MSTHVIHKNGRFNLNFEFLVIALKIRNNDEINEPSVYISEGKTQKKGAVFSREKKGRGEGATYYFGEKRKGIVVEEKVEIGVQMIYFLEHDHLIIGGW